MIRFLLRNIAVLCLAIAVIFAILDGARSVGASHLVVMPLFTMWSANAPETLAGAEALVINYTGTDVWNLICVPALEQPGWVFFGVLAFLFYITGYRRERPLGRFTA